MIRSLFLTVSAALVLLMIASCTGDLSNYRKEECPKLPSDTLFQAIQDNCIRCHKKDFSTKEGVCAHKTRIIDSVTKNRMPKIGKLYPHYRETILGWK